MKMFLWESRTLREHNNGQIIVLAKNIKNAREKVMSAADNLSPEVKAGIAIEILMEPTELGNGVAFIHGKNNVNDL